jgi:hypothetical protein
MEEVFVKLARAGKWARVRKWARVKELGSKLKNQTKNSET